MKFTAKGTRKQGWWFGEQVALFWSDFCFFWLWGWLKMDYKERERMNGLGRRVLVLVFLKMIIHTGEKLTLVSNYIFTN